MEIKAITVPIKVAAYKEYSIRLLSAQVALDFRSEFSKYSGKDAPDGFLLKFAAASICDGEAVLCCTEQEAGMIDHVSFKAIIQEILEANNMLKDDPVAEAKKTLKKTQKK